MNAKQQACARQALDGAEGDTLTFPEIVAMLVEAGFEGYAVDFRRLTATYYLPSGESIELPSPADDGIAVASSFDPERLNSAIREAQTLAPGYSYKGFRRKAKAAGCAGYFISFTGRRALYYSRTAETHVEPFPQ